MTSEGWNQDSHQQVLITIGDITVTPDWVITPQGRQPVGKVNWTFMDMSRTTRVVPTWAIVMTIIFALFCLIGLLFLFVREDRTGGWVQVSVEGEGFYHAAQLPVSGIGQVAEYMRMVDYARSVTASRGRR